jgi:uncharacterized protein (TIGR03083 family)
MASDSPIFVVDLFPQLDQRLIELLRLLPPADWHRPTVCRGWSVKDIASHLLDGNFRRIALHRDGYQSTEKPIIASYQDLVAYLNQLNADWVNATKRLSPAILIELLEQTGQQIYALFKELPPYEDAIFPVGWAGDIVSPNWFDMAREYTERWHHQQQIRLAVDQPGDLLSPPLYAPLLNTFMRALPHTYRAVPAAVGATVRVTLTGDSGGVWTIQRQPERWAFVDASDQVNQPTASVVIDGPIAWRLFTKGLNRTEALQQLTFEGDLLLAEPILMMTAVMG